jgi:uncharacterized lipoprotein YehR (DUF1307 family)
LKKEVISGLISILIIIVMISGCTSSSSAKTYNGSQMSFQYPSDCEVKEIGSENGTFVRVNKDSKTEAAVRIMDNPTETKNAIASSSTYKGQETISGVVCDVYKDSSGIYNYFFQKNGKNILVFSGDLSTDTAKQIIETIQVK